MFLLSNIISSLTGKDEEESVILPCTNCESNCSVYPNACEECKPYKEQLVDALYNVENIGAFYDRYEVVTPGTVIDRYSGADESESKGILGTIVSALTGDAEEKENSLGAAMTEAEIKAMAAKYSVSVKDYLEGLDMGLYLSKTGYEKQQQQQSSSCSSAGRRQRQEIR